MQSYPIFHRLDTPFLTLLISCALHNSFSKISQWQAAKWVHLIKKMVTITKLMHFSLSKESNSKKKTIPFKTYSNRSSGLIKPSLRLRCVRIGQSKVTVGTVTNASSPMVSKKSTCEQPQSMRNTNLRLAKPSQRSSTVHMVLDVCSDMKSGQLRCQMKNS